MCQGCIDEGALSQQTYDLIEAFILQYPDSSFGPAHIVISDCNVFDEHIKWSLGLTKAALSRDAKDLYKPEDIQLMQQMGWYAGDDRQTLTATVDFLEKLLAIPEEER